MIGSIVTDRTIDCILSKSGWRWHITGVEYRDGQRFVVWWDKDLDGRWRWSRGPGAGFAFRSDAVAQLIQSERAAA